jgi:hypothetical protein
MVRQEPKRPTGVTRARHPSQTGHLGRTEAGVDRAALSVDLVSGWLYRQSA